MGEARKAVFLDRDGVINRERGEHTWKIDEMEVLPGVPEALKALRERGWLLVVITNQSGIGLGLYDHADVRRAHRYLHDRLAASGAAPDAVYYCPHHPSQGRCLCRKPAGLLLERAIARFRIDPARSVMIGDRDRDVQAAATVGVSGVLVTANAPLMPVLHQLALL